MRGGLPCGLVPHGSAGVHAWASNRLSVGIPTVRAAYRWGQSINLITTGFFIYTRPNFWFFRLLILPSEDWNGVSVMLKMGETFVLVKLIYPRQYVEGKVAFIVNQREKNVGTLCIETENKLKSLQVNNWQIYNLVKVMHFDNVSTGTLLYCGKSAHGENSNCTHSSSPM